MVDSRVSRRASGGVDANQGKAIVGASLLAKAVCQLASKGLEYRYREQARSHRVSMFAQESVKEMLHI